MRVHTLRGFGTRLTEIRRSRGLTQAALGKTAGLSQRMIAYYEQDDAQPPAAVVVHLARALRVSTDELLGMREFKESPSPRNTRLLKRLENVERLAASDRRALLKFLDLLLTNQGRATAQG
ncbi:MAG: helix-turn-helix transcriptional regulator [Candidatus Wallbacteria bacterium]|nr:helix-turn-helix transcriptional regulator [Candidatus Wallbacteria bacterium]